MLVNKTVKSIDHDDAGATVHCTDGSSYRGDVVVGCDGVNSRASVRSEMVRIAGEVAPGHFPETEKTSECNS
jgi:2-polyprenyl-6-methoxyphenol hydroxylase-like FAD-dependent oxidoreductase